MSAAALLAIPALFLVAAFVVMVNAHFDRRRAAIVDAMFAELVEEARCRG